MQVNSASSQSVIPPGSAVPYRRVKHLTITKREGRNGSAPVYFVRTSPKEVFQFGEEEHLLCLLLDGTRSVAEIQSEFKRQSGNDLPRVKFDGLLAEFLECGIVEADPELRKTEFSPTEDPAAVVDEEFVETIDDDIDEFSPELDVPQLPGAAGSRFAVKLFDPSGLLEALDLLGGPLRHYAWAVLPGMLACLVLLVLGPQAVAADVTLLKPDIAAILVAVSVVAVCVISALTQAVMATFHGRGCHVFGIAVKRHTLPRVRFSDAGWDTLKGREALRVTVAPLTARLVLFAIATTVWLTWPDAGDLVSVSALIVGQVALWAFFIGSAPFAPTLGRKFLTTLLGRSDLWSLGGVHRAHLLALSGLWGLGVLGLTAFYLNAATRAGLIAPGLLDFGVRDVDAAIGQIALPLLTITPIATWVWVRMMVKGQNLSYVAYLSQDVSSRALPAEPAPGVPEPRPPGVVVPINREVGQGAAVGRQPQTDAQPSRYVLPKILAVTMAVGFLPYPYEAGGNFTILPHDSAQLDARVPGELTEVLVDEGEKVVPGQILGILSDWDEQANLKVSQAQLENAKANLQALYETPKPEELELARKQYELATSKLAYDRAQFQRASDLVKTDAVSRSSYDQTVSQLQQDQAAAEVARANYDDARAGPTPAQFDAARAKVRQDAATVAYNEDQMERTRIRATSYGTMVTPNPMLLRGKWFNQGDMVFTVQDLGSVQADVQVPETDIGNVQIGGATRLRQWSYPDRTFTGRAIAIAGDAQPDPSSGGNVVRVRTEVPNPDGALHPTMTGYAKISGNYMPTWRAFTLMLIRFITIESWSFIP